MQRVSVYSIQHRKDASKPYIVKWSIDGRHRSRAHRTKALADRYRSRLVAAVDAAEPFSTTTGEPQAWSAQVETFLTLAQRVVQARWGSWSPMSRRAAVESIEAACVALVSVEAPLPPAHGPLGPHDMAPVRRWLWDCWLLPAADARAAAGEEVAAAEWLQRWSLPVKDIDGRTIKRIRPALSVGVSGKPLGPDSVGKRRNNLSLVLTEAVTDGLLPSNPVALSRWTVKADDDAVDARLVMDPAQCRALIATVGQVSTTAERYTAYLHTLWLAGLRPSEATGIVYDPADVQLPASGWGRLILRGGTVQTAKRWTDTGEAVHQDRGLKWRARKAIREVPIPPELVTVLRTHVETYKVKTGDRLFTNSQGAPVDSGALGKLWRNAKEKHGLTGVLAGTRIYDLRHSNASLLLRAGVSVPEVARRLGHSPAVLLRTYAQVVQADETVGNAKIEAALAG